MRINFFIGQAPDYEHDAHLLIEDNNQSSGKHLNWSPPGTRLKPVPSSRFREYTDHVTGS